MAYALVKAGVVSTVAGATSVHPAFGQATAAGNLLIGWIAGNSSNVVDTVDQGWTILPYPKFSTAGAAIAYKANCAAVETSPTFSNGAGGALTACAAALAEFSGGDTVSPQDLHKEGVGAATSPQAVTNTGVDAAAGELFVSAGSWVHSKAETTTTTDTYNNGATPTTNLNNDGTSTASHYRFAWGTTTSNSAADQDSQSDSSMNISAGIVVIASFKLASATTFIEAPAIQALQAVNRSSVW